MFRLTYTTLRFYTPQPSLLSDKVLVLADSSKVSYKNFFGGKKVVVFGVPGAFTPVCSNKHVPSYLNKYDELKNAGFDAVVCVSVNDQFVMNAWAGACNDSDKKITYVADWDGSFTKAVGMDTDLSAANLGVRSKRYSLIVDNGEITHKNVEISPANFDTTSAENILAQAAETKKE